jgi:hypothetical protein
MTDKFGRDEIFVGGFQDDFPVLKCRANEVEVEVYKYQPVDYNPGEYLHGTSSEIGRDDKILGEVKICVPKKLARELGL